MADIIIDKIQIKRGLKANLPVLDIAEPALCTDTGEIALGTSTGNIFINFSTLKLAELNRFGVNLNNKLTIDGAEFAGGNSASAGALVYNTLTELQTAYPNGTTQPVWIVADNAWYYWSGTVAPPADTTAPTLTITAGGTFTGTKTVTLSATDANAVTIYYTLNGSEPTTASAVYSGPLSVTATTTLKAFAKDSAGNTSATQTIVYTLDAGVPADTTPPTNVSGLQVTGQTANSISLSWTTVSDAVSYDVYNGSTLLANVTGTTYTATGLSASTQYTLTVKAKDAANNVASGSSVTGTTTAPPDTTAPVLTITPAATFTTTQTVTMTANEAATIYYTLDDTDPKISGTKLTYTAPLTLTETDTIKAYARDTAGNESNVQTVTYTLAPYVTTGLIRFVENPGSGSLFTNPSELFGGTTEWTFSTTMQTSDTASTKNIVMRTIDTATSGGITGSSPALQLTFEEKAVLNIWGRNTTNNASTWVTIGAGVETVLTPNVNHHLVLMRKGTSLDLYIDNVKVKSSAIASTIDLHTNSNALTYGGTGITGINYAYYNRALTSDELTRNYNTWK